jgi:hypothetical protein
MPWQIRATQLSYYPDLRRTASPHHYSVFPALMHSKSDPGLSQNDGVVNHVENNARFKTAGLLKQKRVGHAQ